MDHIKEELRYLMSKSDAERIDFILRDLWIGYPKGQEVLSKMDSLLKHPKINRMPSMLLVGNTNNGKTILLKRFLDINPAFLDETEEHLTVPVLYVQSPPVPDEKRFYNAILDQTYSPYRINDKLDKRLSQVLNVLRKLSVKVLIIDEIHHVLGGTMSKRTSFLNVIKYLSNELNISIIGAGTKDAFNAISTDPQLINRFEPTVLPKWSYDKNYLRLLASIEYSLPIKFKSNIYSNQELAKKIYFLSEGTIGEITTVVKRSAVKAIEMGVEQITSGVLNNLDFVPPSERRHTSSIL